MLKVRLAYSCSDLFKAPGADPVIGWGFRRVHSISINKRHACELLVCYTDSIGWSRMEMMVDQQINDAQRDTPVVVCLYLHVSCRRSATIGSVRPGIL